MSQSRGPSKGAPSKEARTQSNDKPAAPPPSAPNLSQPKEPKTLSSPRDNRDELIETLKTQLKEVNNMLKQYTADYADLAKDNKKQRSIALSLRRLYDDAVAKLNSARNSRPRNAPTLAIQHVGLLKRAVAPFPTSPLPRQSLGRHTVCVKPPKRGDKQSFDEDYRIPENHMVFFAFPKNEARLNMKGVPLSSHQRRAGVVGNVFANWHNRSFLDVEADFNTEEYYVRFAGVSYEGIDDPVGAKRHPDSKGRFTISINGVVTIYTRTDQLEKDGAKLGDPLEWVPVGCQQSWRQLGPKFEPCRVRVWKRENYFGKSKPVSGRRTSSRMTAINTKDPLTSGQEFTEDGYTVVPSDEEGRKRYDRIEGPTQDMSPDYKNLLKMIDFSEDEIKDHNVAGAYLELIRKLSDGNKLPFGLDKNNATLDQKVFESENFMHMIGAMLASGMLMDKTVTIDDNGQGSQTLFAPAQFILEMFQQIRQNGLNPESMDYLYPGDFDAAITKFLSAPEYDNLRNAVDILLKHKIITDNTGDKKFHLDMTKYMDIKTSGDREAARNALETVTKTIGDPTGRLLFASALAAVYEAIASGAEVKYPTSSPSHVYTWDLVHQMAGKLKDAQNVKRQIDKIQELVEERKGNEEILAALQRLINSSEGISYDDTLVLKNIGSAIANLLKNPMIGVSVDESHLNDGTKLAEHVDKAREKLGHLEDSIRKLANQVGVTMSITGALSPDTMQDILEKVEEISEDAMYEVDSEGKLTVADDILFPDRFVDLIIKEVKRERLTPEQHHYVLKQLNRLRQKNVDPAVVRDGIRAFVETYSDSSVQIFSRVAGPFALAIKNLEGNVRSEMRRAVNHYLHASDLAQDSPAIVNAYISKLGPERAGDQHFVDFLPEALKSIKTLRRDDATITANIFVGCVRLAGAMAEEIFGGDSVSDLKDMFEIHGSGFEQIEFPWAPSGHPLSALYDPEDNFSKAVFLPRMNPTHDAMYGVTRSITDQILTMMGNTVAFGSMLCAMASDSAANGRDFVTDKYDLFRFSNQANQAMQQPLLLDFFVEEATFDAYKTQIATYVQNNQIVTAISNSGSSKNIEIGVINPKNPAQFTRFLEWLSAHRRACHYLRISISLARLYTANLDTTVAGISSEYAKFVKRIEDNVLNQHETESDIAKTFRGIEDSIKLSADQFAVQFSKYLPRDDVYDDVDFQPATQPCYFHDHPLAAALYCGEYAGDTYSAERAKAWCCPKPEAGYEAFGKIRPGGSMAPLATFYEAAIGRSLDDPQDFNALLSALDITLKYLTTDPATGSIQAQASFMRVAQKVLPSEEFADRSRQVAKHTRAMKRSMMNAVRSAYDARLGHVAVTSARAGAFFDGEENLEIIDERKDLGFAAGDRASLQSNPRQRVFGTLLGIQENMIRVMLNPALSIA